MDRRYTNDSPRSQREPEPDPFKTRMIPRQNAWWGLALCGGIAVGMLVLLILMWKNAFDGFQAILATLAASAFFLIGLFGIGQSIYYLIFKFHLLLTRNSIQLRNRDGDVLGQIPYRNVDSLDVVIRRDQVGGIKTEVLKIVLSDPDDRKTWWKGWRAGDDSIEVQNHFEEPIRDIRDWIGERVELIQEGADPAATAVEEHDAEDTDFEADDRGPRRRPGTATRRRPAARASRSWDDEEKPLSLRTVWAGMPLWAWGLVGGAVFLSVVVLAICLSVGSHEPSPAVAPALSREAILPSVHDPDASRAYLSDLPEFDVRPVPPGWRFGKNGALGGSPVEPPRVVVHGLTYEKALSTHPPANTYSGVKYRIAPAAFFQTHVGIADSAPVAEIKGELTFEVLGDGKLLWRSRPIRQRGQFQECRVAVPGVQVLELRVHPPAGPQPPYGGHAVWLNPYVTRPGR